MVLCRVSPFCCQQNKRIVWPLRVVVYPSVVYKALIKGLFVLDQILNLLSQGSDNSLSHSREHITWLCFHFNPNLIVHATFFL